MKLLLLWLILQLLATVILSHQACEEGALRLVGGLDDTHGRVELCVGDQWGTVCDDRWDSEDANVVCGQLGFEPGAIATSGAFFGEGSGPILLDEVRCDGKERRLLNCTHNGVGRHNCGHSEDAGVICKLPITNTTCCNNTFNSANTCTGLGATGAFTTILLLIVISLSIGWILTIVFMRRKYLQQGKCHITKREDEVCDLHNPVYTGASGVEPPNESLPAEYTIPVPAYEVVSPMSETPLSLTTEQHEYDVISQQQRQAEVVSQADETEDYSRLQH